MRRRSAVAQLTCSFITTVLGILLLEGIGRDLDPGASPPSRRADRADLDLFRAALPILRQVGTQMRTSDIKDLKSDGASLLPMIKVREWPVRRLTPQLYLLVEFNGLRTLGQQEIDDLVRYDTLSPSL